MLCLVVLWFGNFLFRVVLLFVGFVLITFWFGLDGIVVFLLFNVLYLL